MIVCGDMNIQNSIRRLLLIVPVIFTTALAACANLAGTPRTNATVNLQRPAVGKDQVSNYVAIGPRSYNAETRSYERPWPFGPEYNPQ